MSNADLATEALDVLFTLVRAALVWVIALLALLTLATLGLTALLLKLADLIRHNDPQEPPMTFHYTDPDGDHIAIGPGLCDAATGQTLLSVDCITITITRQHGTPAGVYIPLNQVEELVAGIRDTARQAAAQGESAGAFTPDPPIGCLTTRNDPQEQP